MFMRIRRIFAFKKQNVKQYCFLITVVLSIILLCSFDSYANSHEGFAFRAKTPAVLIQHDEETIRAVLETQVPDLKVHTIEMISWGYNNLVADVNDAWIFRFPRREGKVSELQREQWLLNQLQSHVTAPIPFYQYVGKKTAFVGYPKLKGQTLSTETYLALSDQEKEELAGTLALFMTQLHSTISVEEARKHGYYDNDLPLERIKETLIDTLEPSELKSMLVEALEYAEQHPATEEDLVFLHGDLHGGNLLFDKTTKQITGIIDFSDAGIGHYGIEFSQLISLCPELAMRTAEGYSALRGVDIALKEALVDYVLRRAWNVCYEKKHGNVSEEKAMMDILQNDVLPIWKDFQKSSRIFTER